MVTSKRIIVDTGNRRGLDEAAGYVTNGWFPINPARLRDLRGKLASGFYKANPAKFLRDIKEDASLLASCMRGLGQIAKGEELKESPVELLRNLDQGGIESILSIALQNMPAHEFDMSQKPQLMQLRQSIISSCTAETMAESYSGDGDLAFVTASVRQLGLNLVAWNYPRIYSKALQSLKKGNEELDELLFATLGYSPLQLGYKVALEWCGNPVIEQAVLGGESLSPEAQELRHYCEIGETLAKVNDAEFFPSAAARWEGLVEQVSQQLGPSGMSKIQSKVEEYSASYQKLSQGAFKVDLTVERNLKTAVEMHSTRLLARNPYAQKCPSEVVEAFKAVYSEVTPGQPSTTAVQVLVGEVIPMLGFTKGCVYLVDTKRMQVVPMLRIGESSLSRYRALSCGDSVEANHPAVSALSYTAPIIQQDAFLHGEKVSHVTGAFGAREKPGVLYLEMSPDMASGDRQTSLLYFKAIKQCLCDCLSLGCG